MPQRIVTERDNASDVLDSLSPEEERLYKRMLGGSTDDYGLFDAHPSVVRSDTWKRNSDLVTVDQIEQWMQGLAAKGVLELYEVAGQRYGQMLVWQQKPPRAQKSKFPAPPFASTPTTAYGSADLPTETPAAVPPVAESQGAVPGGQEEERKVELVDADRNAPVRQQRWYREFDEKCRDNGMEQWCKEAPFLQLYKALMGTAGRDPAILVEVADEAAKTAATTPGSTYGLRIIQNLPGHVRTRQQALEHFEARRAAGGATVQAQHNAAAGNDESPPEEDDDPLVRRARQQAEELRRQSHAAAS